MKNPEEEQANIGCNGIQLRLRLLLQIPPLLDMKALCFAYIYCNARMLKRHLFRWLKSSKWALQTYSKMTISSLYCAIYKYEFAIRIHQLIWYSSSLAPSDANLPPYRIWKLYALLRFYCWKDIYLGDSSHQNGLYRFTSKLLLAFLHHTVQKYHFALRTKWAVHTKCISENPVSIVVSSSWKFTPSWECSILSTPIFLDISKWLESVVWV